MFKGKGVVRKKERPAWKPVKGLRGGEQRNANNQPERSGVTS